MQVKTNQAFYAFFIRESGFWFLDCTSWDRQEILTIFNEDVSSLVNKRLVKLSNDDEDTIKKARRYLTFRNTKTFIDLTRVELD